MSDEIQDALNALATIIKTIDVTNPPESRVWTHPGQSTQINMENLPAVIIAKMNTTTGHWGTASYGAGEHKWQMLVAVYLEEGPVSITNSDEVTLRAIEYGNEWYKKLADILFANITLASTVDIVGDDEGQLFTYITDNIIWDAKHYYGHLFSIPVTQTIIQGVSA